MHTKIFKAISGLNERLMKINERLMKINERRNIRIIL